MKKAQIEIVGLAIIMVLLVFIAIFALSFMVKPKQHDESLLRIKANALRAGILKTDVCSQVSAKDEIENCIDNYNECGSCDKLKQDIINMITSSLEANERYSFIVSDDYGGKFINMNNCADNITAASQDLRNGRVDLILCNRG